MVKMIGGLLIFGLTGICLICGCGSWTAPAGNTFPAVVCSDIHFNPFYDPTLFPALVAAEAEQWEGIFKTSSIAAPSTWGTDTNYPLLVLAMAGIQQNVGASPLVLYTGDLLGHNFAQTFYQLYGRQDEAAMKAFTVKTAAFVMGQVRAAAGNIPVLFTVGNSDSYSGAGPDRSFLADTAELYYTQFVQGAADHQAFLNTFLNAGYYSAALPGTKVTVIGLNTVLLATQFSEDGDRTALAELDWLDSTLAAAEAGGRKVWLLMHVPPGADLATTAQKADGSGHLASATMMWYADYQGSFLQILAKHPGVITLTLAAHTHMDEYRLLSRAQVLEQTPAISPVFGNNPAFKIFTFSADTYQPTDYRALNYDLATRPGQFNSYYTFSTAYSRPGYLNNALAQLFPTLATNPALQTLYRGFYYSGNNGANPITNTNWPVYWCGIGNLGQQELMDCVNSHGVHQQ